MALYSPRKVWTQQTTAAISQTNPVSATLYPVLAATRDVRIISISARITWAVTQPTPLEIIVTIDGKIYTMAQANPVSDTVYIANIDPYATLQSNSSDTPAQGRAFLLEGKSVAIAARITWAVTQPTPLICKAIYAKLT